MHFYIILPTMLSSLKRLFPSPIINKHHHHILQGLTNLPLFSLLSHRACCYIYFIQTNSCTLFKTHSHLKIYIVKNVCKTHQLKPCMFRSQLFDHLQGVVFATQTSREGSNSTKHERRPPEDGQTIVTETCRLLIDVFYKHF